MSAVALRERGWARLLVIYGIITDRCFMGFAVSAAADMSLEFVGFLLTQIKWRKL